MATISSLAHELNSLGREILTKGFKQAARATNKGGRMVPRDFCPPNWQCGEIELLTPFSKKFSQFFTEYFNPPDKSKWASEFDLRNNILETNSLYAFELLTHFRMFVHDRSERSKTQMLAKDKKFARWPQLTESYVLTGKNHLTIEKVLDDLMTEAVSHGPLFLELLKFTDDDGDDRMLQEHFIIKGMPNYFPSKRFTAVIKKAEGLVK